MCGIAGFFLTGPLGPEAPQLARAMGDALRLGTYAGVALLRPFIALDKGQIAAEGARLGVDFALTVSICPNLFRFRSTG